jgi:hypothetical protein
VASLAYLGLPAAVFVAGWLRPAWALLLTASLVVGVAIWARRLCGVQGVDGPVLPLGALVSGSSMVVGVVALSGAGGFGVQTWDWNKHNAILKDLIEQPWPVTYATGESHVALVYYVAYYLPAALVGKTAGWSTANVALFAWSATGAVLAFLWLTVLSTASVWRCLGVFVFFSGLDMVGAAVWSTRWPSVVAWIRDFDVEWWAKHWNYSGNVTLLAYAPHQALGAWLLTGLTLDGLRRYPGRAPHVLAAALGLLWSPFATVGLLGIAVVDWAIAWRDRGGVGALLRGGADLAGLLVGLVLTAYFLSRYPPVALPAAYYPPPDRIEAAALAFVPARLPATEFGVAYAMFVTLEFLLLVALLAFAYRDRSERRLLAVVTVTLLALPWFHYGFYNDLVMRASIPALFTLQVLAVRAAEVVPRRSALAGAIIALLAVGAAYPANMLRMQVRFVVASRTLVRIPARPAVADLFQQQLAMRGSYFFVGQYVGGLNAPFFRLLARRPTPVPQGDPGRS